MKEVKALAEKMLDLVAEVEQYQYYRKHVLASSDELFARYQKKQLSYVAYEKELSKLLKGKDKKDTIAQYDAHIANLLKRIETYNNQLFYRAFQDTKHADLEVHKAPTVFAKESLDTSALAKGAPVPAKVVSKEPSLQDVLHEPTAEDLVHFDEHKAKREIVKLAEKKKKPSFWASIFKKKHAAIEGQHEESVSMGSIWASVKAFFGVRQAMGDENDVEDSLLRLQVIEKEEQPELQEQLEAITATALTKEAKRVKNILARRKELKAYHPSFFGSIANVLIKRISLVLLEQFPEFFKRLYTQIRLANIKILSNTYVNMMVFSVLFSSLIGFVLFGLFFLSIGAPMNEALVKTLFMGFITGGIAFFAFYSYPYTKASQRRRSINTNLPFAINHMSAVASSGVPPAKMFMLISASREYGEICVEIEKIVNYVEIFGYDLFTAIKSVAATTPSLDFKEFFEGMIATTQGGGDLKQYLSQKSDEAMLNYRLERQKYTETISTYSDVYTGILIAAPLFFIASLSLVSLLGGTVGDIDVNVLIVVGVYLVIPMLNVLFLVFLELTQPEI